MTPDGVPYDGIIRSGLVVRGTQQLHVSTTMRNCGLCSNNCMLTINTFSDGRKICKQEIVVIIGAGDMIQEKHKTVPNLVDIKLRRIFDYYLKKNIPEFEGNFALVSLVSSICTRISRSGSHSLITSAVRWCFHRQRRRINTTVPLIRFHPTRRAIQRRPFMVTFVSLQTARLISFGIHAFNMGRKGI